MKKPVKVILGLLLFALFFTLLYIDDERRTLPQLLEFPEGPAVEITCGGINHGRTCTLTDADRRAVLEELSAVEYAPFKRSRVPYDFKKEFFYITVTDFTYYRRFDIYADAGYGTVNGIAFTLSDDFLSLLRSFPFQT